MRTLSFLRYLTLAASLLPTAYSLQPLRREDGASGDLLTGQTTGGGDSTTFNGKSVPEMASLTSDNLTPIIAHGYWLVEFFSPYCGHCRHFAPTWQLLYELYYTQDILSSTEKGDAISFTQYYDYHFGRVDCASNGDACANSKIGQFPTVVLFKDSVEVKKSVGGKDIKAMSAFVEETLETIWPGSRPKDGLKLPKVGEHEVEKTLMPEQAPGPVIKDGSGTTTVSGTKSMVSATKVPILATPNPDGKSKALTAENFQRLVTTTHDPWFIKFYVPWCHHCQALAPNWQGMARQMRGKLNIGEVNCETEKRLCKDVKVKGYPTLLFFRGGERIEYDGLRGLGDLLDFSNKAIAVAEPIMDVDAAKFAELEKKEEVLFLYFYDHATTAEDFAALERLTMSLIGHAKLVKTDDPVLCERYKISTWPRLLVSRDGKPTYYTALSPRDMRDFRRVLNWMQSVWLPIVPELTASNAKEVMGGGKLVVLGILSRDRGEDFISAKREIKNAALEWIDKQTQAFQLERQELRDAKQLRIEEAEDRNDQRALRAAKSIRINMDDIERRDVGFAWVDGTFWERWIRTTFGISVLTDNERVVMYDYSSHRYWDVTMTGNPIVPSRTSILETLPRVVSSPPKIAAKRTMSVVGHAWWTVKEQVFEHPRVSIGVSVGALICIVIFVRRHGRNIDLSAALPSYFQVGEKGNAMDGLLGGSPGGSGKVD
ncbi:hypothetical protein LTR62_004745 [Meristemomyces frigidus]|uniref:Thioredoxin domain-containing protein n=1 Tax=Meristemomyces frigidus TaxID=1508187 RepID=A0AAN7YR67_9PEZI|nr:hypothetical protein LTR62_004745 [Meristemomyces frigidus]